MNNIETGCKAIIINSQAGNNGISVVVGKYIGNIAGIAGDRWEVDKALRTCYADGIFHTYTYSSDETKLMRIDGFEEIESMKTCEILEL